MQVRIHALTCCLLAIVAAPALAQTYPAKPLRMIVPQPPGGAADLLGRLVGQKLSERMGQPVIVESRPGAGGQIGAEFVAKSQPDGYTIMIGGVGHAINQSLYEKPLFVLTTDLTAIAEVATYPSMIVVHPSLPVKSMKELIALARAKPDALNFGASPGSPNHLAMELVKVMTKVKMTYIGYKGTGPVIIDLLGGHLHCASVGFPGVSPHVTSGRLRALAVTTTKRSPLFPELPTVAESAIPGYHVSSWWGVFGPARLPSQIVGRLNTEIRGFMDGDDVKARLSGLGADVETTTSEEFAKIVRSEVVRWAPIVKASGAKAP
jgi:tripartite-type tricarboxylate transporter receptor subunit TctC